VLPSPFSFTSSSWVMPSIRTVTGSPSGSVTPRMSMSTILWLGGQSEERLGFALHLGGSLMSVPR